MNDQDAAPIILVPGFWLGAWAWDEVAGLLRADGHDVTALTLPGLDAAATDRSAITAADHVDAICAAITAARGPVVLAVHSAAGFPGYAASDRLPERIAAMVYVDTAPGRGAMDRGFEAAELPLPSPGDLAAAENLDGLSAEQLDTFQRRAVPEPGGVLRTAVELTNEARRDVPSTIICTGFPSDKVKEYAESDNPPWLAGLAELRDTTWIDLPTSHWPMWSRPQELAAIIDAVARSHPPEG
jgi:pimeloyl-ACP methyl ester carboxylesterase